MPRLFALLITTLLTLGPLSAPGKESHLPQVVLMTTLEMEGVRPFGAAASFRFEDKWADIVRKRFQAFPVEVKVVHKATQSDLWQALNSPRTLALFWLSHANSGALAAGVNSNLILDANGADVAPLFRHPHLGLRFLAVVGCKAKPILEEFRRQGDYRFHPMMRVWAENDTLDASAGLIRAATQAYLYFGHYRVDNKPVLQPPPRPQIPIQLTRASMNGAELAEARLEWKGRVLAVFPPAPPETVQKQTIQFHLSAEASPQDLTLVLSNGGGPIKESESLGLLDLQTTGAWSWTLLAHPNGAPVGRTMNVYRARPTP